MCVQSYFCSRPYLGIVAKPDCRLLDKDLGCKQVQRMPSPYVASSLHEHVGPSSGAQLWFKVVAKDLHRNQVQQTS